MVTRMHNEGVLRGSSSFLHVHAGLSAQGRGTAGMATGC